LVCSLGANTTTAAVRFFTFDMHLNFTLALFAFLAIIAAGAAQAQNQTSVGDRLLRTFLVFQKEPLTVAEARQNGWYPLNTTCDPNYGFAYAKSSSGPTATEPVTLYYTAGGQLGGFGVRVTGHVEKFLVDRGFWRHVHGDSYENFIRTRDASLMCSGAVSPYPIGDRLEIGGVFNIPLNDSEAVKQGWIPGNCIGGMGVHYAYDLAAFGKNTWNVSTLLPMMPMYDIHRHTINAVLFNVPHWEYTEPAGVFEGPFTSSFFCYNWCANSGCNFKGATLWSTLHFLFVDPLTIDCNGAPCKY